MSQDANSQADNPAEKTGAERRENFRINTELRLAVDPLGQSENSQPWAYAEDGSLSPLIMPGKRQVEQAFKRLELEAPRQVNLSAGGLRTSFPMTVGKQAVPQQEEEWVSILLELRVEDDPEVTLVHLPAWVVWIDSSAKGKFAGFKFGRMPNGIERVFTQYVREVERRRLRRSKKPEEE